MAWSVGQQLQRGKYTIEKELGSGRFGITYLTRDRTSQPYVLKTLNDTLLNQLTPAELNRLWLDLFGVVPQIPQPWRNWDLTMWLTIIGTIAGILSMIAGFLALKPPSEPPPEPTLEITPTSQQIQPETRSLDLTPP